jgi:hypothetical protein
VVAFEESVFSAAMIVVEKVVISTKKVVTIATSLIIIPPFFLRIRYPAAKIAQYEISIQPWQRFFSSDVEIVTGPFVVFRFFYHVRPDRIEMNVPGKRLGIFIPFYQNGLVASLKQVTASFSLNIEIRCIGAIDMAHYLWQVGRSY